MKHLVLVIAFFCCVFCLSAQTYPEPEFSNEVNYLKKDSIHSVMRLEKVSSKMDTKMKMGGFGGSEMGYVVDGEKSTVRLTKRPDLSFVFSSGATTARKYSPQEDSMMRANGVDPSMMSGSGMGGMDPTNNITLYKAESEKGKRKILMHKGGGAFGGKKSQSSDKYTFSVKKIREGYWELVIDKPLSKGEYGFTASAYGSSGMDGSITLYTFGID